LAKAGRIAGPRIRAAVKREDYPLCYWWTVVVTFFIGVMELLKRDNALMWHGGSRIPDWAYFGGGQWIAAKI
jgi:hypothetical protein